MDLKTTRPTERPLGPQMTTQVRWVRFHPVLITEVQSNVEGVYVCENNQVKIGYRNALQELNNRIISHTANEYTLLQVA